MAKGIKLVDVMITVRAVIAVEVEDMSAEFQPEQIPARDLREAKDDTSIIQCEVDLWKDIKKLSDLEGLWDGKCLPYGRHGARTIEEILQEFPR